ncbi:Titin-like protein [Heracleum sosnowskyi]|uniref:Titin-like protein n=1 Tax=Heracleum sosnowskyi TaxID=360622 RepID=A0AAD8MJW7_9APIA|nr:Titin-like protein [Heracleum sosnowskyi]
MEYERIHKVQTGLISPTKLKTKLMLHQRKNDGSDNSARTPPYLQDIEFVENSLLASNVDSDEQVCSIGNASFNQSSSSSMVSNGTQGDQSSIWFKELTSGDHKNATRARLQKADSANSSSVHPMRTLDYDLDYDSNASSSSFEFPRGERTVHNSIGGSLLRPRSSKWNDAEKWIMNKQTGAANHSKKSNLQSQVTRVPIMNGIKVVPEYANYDNKSSVKQVDLYQPAPQLSLEKFSFALTGPHSIADQGNETNVPVDLCPHRKDLKEVDSENSSCLTSCFEEPKGLSMRSVSMRDMGTEMTPIPSQEPSRTATPVGATTPLRSSVSSLSSTPRGASASRPAEYSIDFDLKSPTELGSKEWSTQELRLKTRKEIVALGVQLGKTKIAAWASRGEKDKNATAAKHTKVEELRKIEFEKRAAAWEEAEKPKRAARFRREDIKIQAWESQQKAKLDAEMRRIEAKVEQMRADAQAKMVKKVAMAKQRSEEKRDATEAKKTSQSYKLAAQAEHIRRTGRLSSSYMCCAWS